MIIRSAFTTHLSYLDLPRRCRAKPVHNDVRPAVVIAALNPCLDVYCSEFLPGFDPARDFEDNVRFMRNLRHSVGSNGVNVFNFAREYHPKKTLKLSLVAPIGRGLPKSDINQQRAAEENPLRAGASSSRLVMSMSQNDNVCPVPVMGDNRVNYYGPDCKLVRGTHHHLQMTEADKKTVLLALQSVIHGARVLYLDGVPPGHLDLYRPIQEMAQEHRVGLVVDTRDDFLATIMANATDTGTGRLKGLKLNLAEFAKLTGLDSSNLYALLASGNHAEFENKVFAAVKEILATHIQPEASAAFILTCDKYPFYVFNAGKNPLRVTLPVTTIVSPTGSGDSMVGQALPFFADNSVITAERAILLGATGLATAQEPQTRLGSRENIDRLVASNSIIVEEVPWTDSQSLRRAG